MVLIHPLYRSVQQILRKYDKSQSIASYQLNTVPYEMLCSLFFIIRSLDFLADT